MRHRPFGIAAPRHVPPCASWARVITRWSFAASALPTSTNFRGRRLASTWSASLPARSDRRYLSFDEQRSLTKAGAETVMGNIDEMALTGRGFFCPPMSMRSPADDVPLPPQLESELSL